LTIHCTAASPTSPSPAASSATLERRDHAAALEHHDRRAHRPDRRQEQARDEQQRDPDAHADAVDDAHGQQRHDHRADRGEHLPDRGVATPVLHVADQLHHHALVERPEDQGHQVDDDADVAGQGHGRDRLQREDRQRGRDQDPGVLAVDLQRPCDDGARVQRTALHRPRRVRGGR
jgi:hypothetical protein